MTLQQPSHWTVELQEADDGTDDLVMPLPEDLLQQMGWQEGDTLVWAQVDNGRWSLTKKAKA
jgi:hypothetical protein